MHMEKIITLVIIKTKMLNKDELISSKFPSLIRKYPYACGNKLFKTNVISGKTFLHNIR